MEMSEIARQYEVPLDFAQKSTVQIVWIRLFIFVKCIRAPPQITVPFYRAEQ